jgi:hypothetical protein
MPAVVILIPEPPMVSATEFHEAPDLRKLFPAGFEFAMPDQAVFGCHTLIIQY